MKPSELLKKRWEHSLELISGLAILDAEEVTQAYASDLAFRVNDAIKLYIAEAFAAKSLHTDCKQVLELIETYGPFIKFD